MQVFHCSAKLNGWMVGCMNGLYIFSYPIRDLLYGSSHLHLHGDARGCRKASTRCFFKDTLFLRTVRCIDCQRYFLVNSTIYHHKRLDNYVNSSKILLKLCHRKKWCCEGKTFHCRSTGFPTPGCQGCQGARGNFNTVFHEKFLAGRRTPTILKRNATLSSLGGPPFRYSISFFFASKIAGGKCLILLNAVFNAVFN